MKSLVRASICASALVLASVAGQAQAQTAGQTRCSSKGEIETFTCIGKGQLASCKWVAKPLSKCNSTGAKSTASGNKSSSPLLDQLKSDAKRAADDNKVKTKDTTLAPTIDKGTTDKNKVLTDAIAGNAASKAPVLDTSKTDRPGFDNGFGDKPDTIDETVAGSVNQSNPLNGLTQGGGVTGPLADSAPANRGNTAISLLGSGAISDFGQNPFNFYGARHFEAGRAGPEPISETRNGSDIVRTFRDGSTNTIHDGFGEDQSYSGSYSDKNYSLNWSGEIKDGKVVSETQTESSSNREGSRTNTTTVHYKYDAQGNQSVAKKESHTEVNRSDGSGYTEDSVSENGKTTTTRTTHDGNGNTTSETKVTNDMAKMPDPEQGATLPVDVTSSSAVQNQLNQARSGKSGGNVDPNENDDGFSVAPGTAAPNSTRIKQGMVGNPGVAGGLGTRGAVNVNPFKDPTGGGVVDPNDDTVITTGGITQNPGDVFDNKPGPSGLPSNAQDDDEEEDEEDQTASDN